MQEQQAKPSASDSIMPIATSRSRELFAKQAHADAGDEGEADQAGERRKAEQDRTRRAGEADMRQRVAGEGLAAQHEKNSRPSRPERDDAARRRRRCA